ncbi:nipped-B B protein [Rutstroemia sp. NJR-2017a BVV2]|nr:nipped-B B protein [Rutstroemia sp. NJR-2017a BVV2]
MITFCRDLYRKCRAAGGEYDEISREVRGLHAVLKHLKCEVEASDSPLNKDRSIWGKQLAPIIGDCDFTLRQLDELLLKYGRLASDGGAGSAGASGGGRMLWDRMRFGSNEMDQLGGIRVKLISHKTSLTLFLDTIQLHENGKMSKNLNIQGEQLDMILDKVDNIAAKMGQRAVSLMTSYDDDDKEVWKQFRRELIAEGFSSDVLQQHKDVLRAYIRKMEQDGLLDEATPDPQALSPESADTERWIDSTRTAPSDQPPLFNSLKTGRDEDGAKEMINREDNMKFPISMKMEKGLDVMDPYAERELQHTRKQPFPRPILKVSTPDFHETKQQKENSGSSSDSSIRRAKSPANSSIIQTSDLLPSNSVPQLLPPPSPSAYHSQPEDATRSIPLRPKRSSDRKTISPRTSSIQIPGRHSSPQIGSIDISTSPRPESALPRLAPDSYGNEIPPDAKWTKIKRSLVSPEVLDQDGRRYEARPEFVAILGVLTKEEIQDYASRSHVLRENRWRSQQASMPLPSPRSKQRQSRRRDASSSECSESTLSDSSSDSDSGHERRRNDRRRGRDDDRKHRAERRADRSERRALAREERDREREVRYENKERERGERARDREGREREGEERYEKREPSYTFSPIANNNYQQPPSSSPHTNSSTPRPWPIPTSAPPYPASAPPQQYSYPPPFPPQSYTPGDAPPPPLSQRYPPGPQQPYLSPLPYPHSPSSSFPNSYNSNYNYNPYPSPSHSPSSPSAFPPNPPHHRRRHHSHHSSQSKRGDRDRDRAQERDKESGKPTRWRDHLAAAGLGGAAVGLLNVLSEAADGL